MKYIIALIAILLVACNKEPFKAPPTPQTLWIDAETLSDTIITNVKNLSFKIYYAKKNWQQSSNINLANGYRSIAIKFNDSVLVQPLNASNNNYQGPFLFKFNKENDTLKAQNFLDTNSMNMARTFIQLH